MLGYINNPLYRIKLTQHVFCHNLPSPWVVSNPVFFKNVQCSLNIRITKQKRFKSIKKQTKNI